MQSVFGKRTVEQTLSPVRRPLNRPELLFVSRNLEDSKSSRKDLRIALTRSDTCQPVAHLSDIPRTIIYEDSKTSAMETRSVLERMLGELGLDYLRWQAAPAQAGPPSSAQGDKATCVENGRCVPTIALYNADLSEGARELVAADFRAGSTSIVIASDAFGLGVDIAGIERVILWDVAHRPGFRLDACSIVQRMGRAVRDGKSNGTCIVYHPDWMVGERTECTTEVSPSEARTAVPPSASSPAAYRKCVAVVSLLLVPSLARWRPGLRLVR